MSKSQKEMLSDLLIGEAVMSLLEADEEVTFVALLQALTDARDRPENQGRLEAYNMAIADVKTYIASQRSEGHLDARFAATATSESWLLNGLACCSNDRKH
ncbi:hypothetical protein [Superficieibacter sp. HKU1]|uniref:hypothetical protein n=1 Tax=Superficieibacter sp. HKU1 TaxID=3031919 RepID=UPI0023E2E32E|nr:hypothetical protein [Superficieibacter sp. HKU1]WES67300.1 hypothetical protein P0H77_16970 [Superficieibacter sp. HKU1]